MKRFIAGVVVGGLIAGGGVAGAGELVGNRARVDEGGRAVVVLPVDTNEDMVCWDFTPRKRNRVDGVTRFKMVVQVMDPDDCRPWQDARDARAQAKRRRLSVSS